MKEEIFHLGAKGFIFNENGNVLLLQTHSEKWDLPGGRVQKGEHPEATLKREVFEETGLENLQSIEFMLTELTEFRIFNEIRLIFSIYRCEYFGNESIVLSKEHAAFQWMDPRIAKTLLKYPERITNLL